MYTNDEVKKQKYILVIQKKIYIYIYICIYIVAIYVYSHSDTVLENCSKCWYLAFVEGQVDGFHRLGYRIMEED